MWLFEFNFTVLSLCVLLSIWIVCLTWFVLKGDADMTLLFFEKFGKPPDFTGKVVWITGASSGIGECLAYDLARCGAKLILSGVSVEKLENVKKNCIAIPMDEADILILPFLIEDYSVHEKNVAAAIEHFGHIDVLVNNAGRTQRADFKDIEIEVDQNLFAVNVFGAINLTRKVLPHFLERKKGQIVVTSSTAGKIGAPFSCSYTGTKFALHGYFESLRTELRGRIPICLACPGPVFSDLTSRCITGKASEIYDEQQSSGDRKMKTERCSYLMLVAMANHLDECWICYQPMLLLYYVAQYAPSLFRSIMKIAFNPEKIKAIRSGKTRNLT